MQLSEIVQLSESYKDITVAVTRSGDTGIRLQKSLQAMMISAHYLPTLDIKSDEILVPMLDFELAIFISANAVKYGVVNSHTLMDVLPEQVIAIGNATAKTLADAGFQNIVIPEQHTSEGLLALTQLQDVKSCQILIVKGRGGRSLLIDELTKRGAECYPLDVYYRVTKDIDKNTWQQFIDDSKKNKIVTMASVDAMDALTGNLHDNFDYSQLTLVAASQRIADAAVKIGYTDVVVATSASNEAMIKSIEKLVNIRNKDER